MMKPPRIIDLDINKGVKTVLATVYCRRWGVRESLVKADGTSANTPVGFTIQPADNTPGATQYPTTEVVPAPSATQEPLPMYWFPDQTDSSFHGHEGCIIAKGPDVTVGVGVVAALPLFKIASFTNAATSIAVIEEY